MGDFIANDKDTVVAVGSSSLEGVLRKEFVLFCLISPRTTLGLTIITNG